MAANDSFFPSGGPTDEVRLAALGYADDGSRSGGLTFDARVVEVPVGAHLLRLFMKPGDFGTWWFTAAEFRRIMGYFGVDGSVLLTGRAAGGSALHGALALLGDWYGHSVGQLSQFHVAQLTQPLRAMYGAGDVATTAGFGRTLKPLKMPAPGGGQSAARQLYLPEPWTYRHAFRLLTGTGAPTDTDLVPQIARLPQTPLPFE